MRNDFGGKRGEQERDRLYDVDLEARVRLGAVGLCKNLCKVREPRHDGGVEHVVHLALVLRLEVAEPVHHVEQNAHGTHADALVEALAVAEDLEERGQQELQHERQVLVREVVALRKHFCGAASETGEVVGMCNNYRCVTGAHRGSVWSP